MARNQKLTTIKAIICYFEADPSFGRGFVGLGLRTSRHTKIVGRQIPLLQDGDEARGRRHLREHRIKNRI